MDSNKLCFGIDFGTSNSCISIWYNNEPIIIEDFEGTNIIPTVIELQDNKKIIGKEAYNRKEIFEKMEINNSTIYEIKKLIGKNYSDLNEDELNMIGYNISPDENDKIIILDKYYVEEVITHIFMSFKHFSNDFLSKKFKQDIDISNAIISVPARFNDNQRELIKRCAINSGFNVIRLLNEPTSASLAYGVGFTNKNDDQKIVVFDLGGGTLDISILQIYDNNYEVLGSSGNSNLGGSNFDIKIMEYCVKTFIEDNKLEYSKVINELSEKSIQKLKYLSEKAKISLSDNLHTKIIINNFYENLNLEVKINREQFNTLCKDLISLMLKPMNELLFLCELDKNDIDEIILVGGMTKMPIIRQNIELFFNNKELNNSIDPDNVVSIGSAIYGYMLINQETIEDKLLLIDRTSLSIGLETSGGIMDILIPRGSIIPIKKIKKYTTDTDDMESITIKIFEGERKFVKDNFLIGEFTLTGIEKKKRGIPEIQITFYIDHNGIIKIKAEDLNNTLNKKTIQINGNKQNLNQEQIDKIIENAKTMDSIDRIDKMKKQSHYLLIDNSRKILENIQNENLKVENETKETIIKNINEILEWIKNVKYDEIDVEKYKELIDNFNLNYSIFLIHNEPIIELKESNEKEDIGVKIYEDEEYIKLYQDQVNYTRNIIVEYTEYKNYFQYLCINMEDEEQLTYINKLLSSIISVLEFSDQFLINFFISKDINDEYVQNNCNTIYELDIEYKNMFGHYEYKFNLLYKLDKLLNDREQSLFNKLEKLEETEENNEEINSINNKLDIILELQKQVYSYKNKYEEYTNEQLQKLINLIS